MMRVVLVLPVYNEEKILESSVITLLDYFRKNITLDYKIIIVDNASTDKTLDITKKLCNKNKFLEAIHLDEKGRGRALKKAWQNYDSDVYGYCDIDLSTDIGSIKKSIDKIIEGKDIVYGDRYHQNSKTRRTFIRLIFSKIYIFLVRLFFKTKIKDFQCGFKFVNKKIIKEIVSKIEDNEFFFDSELLLKAESAKKYKIYALPVTWKEFGESSGKENSKVRLFETSIKYLFKLIKLKKWSKKI